MVAEYIAAADRLVEHVDDGNLADVLAIAELPQQVRGYEQLKLDRASAYRDELRRRLAALEG